VEEDSTVIRTPKPSSAAPRDRSAYVIVLSGVAVGRMFKLDTGCHTVGRSADADIHLNDDGVSRAHAKLDRREDGTIVLRDLDSTNGTYVNGTKIETRVLNDGDRIQVGSVSILKFSYQDTLEEQFQQQLYESATRDLLTRAYNRRFFDDHLKIEHTHAIRHGMPLSLLMLDIDRFKDTNDAHGHQAGDAVLRTLAATIMGSIRHEDIYCRVGGEEFAVIMRDCMAASALAMAERLRRLIESTPVLHEGKKIGITISIGVATLDPSRHARVEDLFAEADKYLYEAKHAGRNRVCAPPQKP
jgi:diguanylate cyclase (GGDEF)-like protein